MGAGKISMPSGMEIDSLLAVRRQDAASSRMGVLKLNSPYAANMQLTAKIKLQPSDAQADSLKRTQQTENDACNFISDAAWNTLTFGKFQERYKWSR